MFFLLEIVFLFSTVHYALKNSHSYSAPSQLWHVMLLLCVKLYYIGSIKCRFLCLFCTKKVLTIESAQLPTFLKNVFTVLTQNLSFIDEVGALVL